uniref:NADH-ubiquinone oxidoreductase chain 2 n=1 Tax=Rhopaea magnicornis TaxID=272071 RepID=C8YXD0_9SCAR|nr:NADH dehydrogenase subunit 2 [Rhopaea magnicornis]ACO92564.1 NADH dehydrogenase subunit 2 [Rhopaea magnicornis]
MYYKILFTISLMIGTLITISSYSWMGMWLGLEINLLSIIPLMSSTENMMASEAALKYFIVQAMASTFLLFSIIILSLNFMYTQTNLYFTLILNTSLLTKMGAAPFHFWFPEVMDGLNWNLSLIMLTWQKLAPMIILTYFNSPSNYLILIIIASMMISGLLGINQTSLRKILAYSSINHIGWMLSTILIMETVWLYYFIIYSIITVNIITIFKMLNIFHLKQLFISMNYNPLIKFFFIMNFLSLGGLPPFLGFLPKWLTIQTLIQNQIYTLPIMMTIMTLLTLYFYLRITFSTILISSNEVSFYNHPPIKTTWILIFNLIALIGLIFITMLFNFL